MSDTTPKFTKKHLVALGRTLRSYDKLIENPEGQFKKWTRYGDHDACRLCNTTPRKPTPYPNCGVCCLGDGSQGFAAPCVDSAAGTDEPGTFHMLSQAFDHGDPNKIREAAEARKVWIINKARQNGVPNPEEC